MKQLRLRHGFRFVERVISYKSAERGLAKGD